MRVYLTLLNSILEMVEVVNFGMYLLLQVEINETFKEIEKPDLRDGQY